MMSLSRWKVVLTILAVVLGVLFTLPNILPPGTVSQLPGFMPKKTLNLGLDLQGGSYLLLEVDTKALKAEKITNISEDTRATLRKARARLVPAAPAVCCFDDLLRPGIAAPGGSVSTMPTAKFAGSTRSFWL